MKLHFAPSFDHVSASVTRVFLTEDPRGTKRLVREKGVDSLEIGAGPAEEMNLRRFIILCRSIIQAAKANKFRKIAIQFDRTPKLFKNLQEATPEEISSLAAQNFEMANFEFNSFKTKPKEGFFCVDDLYLCGKSSKAIEAAVKKGQVIGSAVNDARELANTPSSDMTPSRLGRAAKGLTKGLPVTVTVYTRAQMEKMGMGAIVGVGKGSAEQPVFIVMEYKGGKGKPVVLAGKGVTFDSGGINLKTDGGHEMHMDMSGGAAVIATVALAARLKLRKNLVGLIPAVENMPGQHAYRIHDILKSLSGKTIEVLNTDAEGRVILSDAITYAKKFKPSVVIDVATLTGAAMVALGQHADALFTRDEKLAEMLADLSETTGDYVWRLPLWDEYEAEVKGTVGDIANAQMGKVRYGGSINGAMFLWQFAKELDCPWAHIDIAPRMSSTPDQELAKGSAGPAVRLLAAFIEQWKG